MTGALLAAFLLFAPPQALTKASPHHNAKPKKSHPSASISPARAREIQAAMVTAGLLDHASGHWDAPTAAAMKHYQAVHHWQTRFVPDARALRALGLVPDPPKTAATAPATAGGPGQ